MWSDKGMICPRCKKRLGQLSGRWTPETPNLTYRKYICHNCRIGYTQIVDSNSHEVINIEETLLKEKKEKQTSLDSW